MFMNMPIIIICIFDQEIKALCLSFNLVPSLVAYDK